MVEWTVEELLDRLKDGREVSEEELKGAETPADPTLPGTTEEAEFERWKR